MMENQYPWGNPFDESICTEVSWPESAADYIRGRGAHRNGADSSCDGPNRAEDGEPATSGPAGNADLW
jgi:hypothetical protein